MARIRLPHTEIVVLIINYCDMLPREEQKYLDEINEYIRDNLNSLRALPSYKLRETICIGRQRQADRCSNTGLLDHNEVKSEMERLIVFYCSKAKLNCGIN